MSKNNKGFSYVELILVIAIMAIMVGIVGLSMGLISRTNVNKAASNLESSMNQARSLAMAKGTSNGVVDIFRNGDIYYIFVGNTSDPDVADRREELIYSPAQVYYYTGDISDENKMSIPNGNRLTIQYNASTGAFASGAPDYIVIQNEDKIRTLKLHEDTGKVEWIY